MNLFWGIVFTGLAFVELFRGYYVVAGIPVWAICLFAIGIANFLKYPRIASAISGDQKRLLVLNRIANVLNIIGLSILVVSIAAVYLL